MLFLAAALAPLGLGACNGGGRPSTSARLQIVQPTPNEVVPAPLHVVLKVLGGRIVPANVTKIRPNQGHVHLSVDGKLVSMNYGLEQDVPGLTSGSHTLQAEFVAADHAPFSNRVIAAVIFKVP